MIVRVSLISLFLVSSSLVGMKLEKFDETPDQTVIELLETTGNTRSISSLQHWREFARKNASLDGYTVLPKAIAEYKQEYEIKRTLPVSPDGITAWEKYQEYPQYIQEVLRIHGYLHSGKETRNNVELDALKNLFIKKAYEQLDVNSQKLLVKQDMYSLRNKWLIGLSIAAVLLGVALVLEILYLPETYCRRY